MWQPTVQPWFHHPSGEDVRRALARGWEALRSSETALVLGLIGVALLAHALNMFDYPSFTSKDDEGIYASQAWSVLRLGKLTPYTYFYDHPPAGWILVATWMGVTGGPNTFGGAIDSGRVLMLTLHLAAVPMLYQVARKLGCPPRYAALATLLFSLSPLAVANQRLLLLDNILVFWLLLSLNLLLDGWGRLSRLALSGVCFGIAVLSKETAMVFLVPMVFIVLRQRFEHQGRFAVAGWVLPMALVVSLYPLYALLKGELFPAGSAAGFSLFGGSGVSLTEALQWQAGRGGGGIFSLHNSFWNLVRGEWLPLDPVLLLGGAAATVANLLRGRRDRLAMVAGLLGTFPFLYLARGGVVFDYYIIVAIPFLSLNLAMLLASPWLNRFRLAAGDAANLVSWALPSFRRFRLASSGSLSLMWPPLLLVFYLAWGSVQPLYTQNPSDAGRRALSWIKKNLPSRGAIVAPDDFWTDLREPVHGTASFANVHSHWKVAGDPDVRKGVFNNDWRKVDYLILSPGLEAIFASTGNTVALEAFRHSSMVRRWEAYGDVVELRKVHDGGAAEARLLRGSDSYIQRRFERSGAYRGARGIVFSESQAYAMLRAVWSGDRTQFERVWRWTRQHLLARSYLPAWKWRKHVLDRQSATDADTDMALALLLAGKRWDDVGLLRSGRRMVRSIWRHEVTVVKHTPYITAGPWATRGPVVALNPSYFSPYAYRVFAEVDRRHNWYGVIDSGYRVLFNASSARLGGRRSAGLPPDWVGLTRANRRIVPLRTRGHQTTRYGYDAARTYWRVALDLRWGLDGRARAYLRQAGFLRDEVRRAGEVEAVYGHDGRVMGDDPSLVGTAGAVSALLTLDPEAGHRLFARELVGAARRAGPSFYWRPARDLYAQEWGWFVTALYAERLPNLWYQT